ncbi:hypothetical protein FHG87_010946 [Trinorchestia longiramus]|nr:hypothetical protein FHG87_010946 [Trinorchestia longiramus]
MTMLQFSVIFPWRRSDQSRERELSTAGCQTEADQSRTGPQTNSNVESNQDGTTRVLISRRSSALNRRSESCPDSEDLSLQKQSEVVNLKNRVSCIEDHNALVTTSAADNLNRNTKKYEPNRSVSRQEGKTSGREGRRRPSKDGGVQTNNKRNMSNSPVYGRASRSNSQWDTLSPAGGEYRAEEAGQMLEVEQPPVTTLTPHTTCNHLNPHNTSNCNTCNQNTSYNTTCNHLNPHNTSNCNTCNQNTSYNTTCNHLNPQNASNCNTCNHSAGYKSLYNVNNHATRYNSNHAPHSKSIGTQCSPEGSESDLNSTFSTRVDEVQVIGNGRALEAINSNIVNQPSRSNEAYDGLSGTEFINGSLVDHLNNPAMIGMEDQTDDLTRHQSLPHMTQLQLQQHLQQRHDSSGVISVAPNSGMFQKFKKSLSLRLTKKSGSRSESPSEGLTCSGAPQSAPVEAGHVEPATLPRRRGSGNREEDKAVYL